jgi:hypothetical protein
MRAIDVAHTIRRFPRQTACIGVILFLGCSRVASSVWAADPAAPPSNVQMLATTTNRTASTSLAPVRHRLVVEGPLAQPSLTLRKSRQTGLRASPGKAWLNLINPFAPVNPSSTAEVSSEVNFDPMSMGKVQPRAFRDDRTHEPSSLISFRIEAVKP